MRRDIAASGFAVAVLIAPLIVAVCGCTLPGGEETPNPEAKAPQRDTIESRITTVPFRRSDPSTPFETMTLFCTDEAGARAMVGSPGFRRTPEGLVRFSNGAFYVGIKCQEKLLGGFRTSGRSYVVGEGETRFAIMVRNRTACRVECVLSVDGLDVLDGKAASFSKRGYIIDPGDTIEVEGFRRSAAAVEPFRFRRAEVLEKTNDGVIGVALFNESGTDPLKSFSPRDPK